MSTFVERVNQADLWLLDKVFQPASDRLPERLPAAELGMSLQLGAIVFFFSAIAILVFSGQVSLGSSMFNILNWVLFVAFYLAVMKMRALIRPGQANPLRSFLLGMRPLNVVWLVISFWSGITGTGPLMLADLFVMISNLIFVIGLYLVSCQPRPPSRRTSKSRVELRPIMGGLRD
ncbi:hypothetical protein [Asaia astilbis]|uniref:hypothetical protein n=1 Tax=Asaia astilbis TaxID=610244 RepID=UPI000564708A|nr:hypothetical protein [Asaia astilbis]